MGVGELLREPFNESFDGEIEPLRLRLLMLGIGEGLGALVSETILIPRLVLVAAGMNNVVRLLSAGMAILLGWFPLHPAVVSCVPVE